MRERKTLSMLQYCVEGGKIKNLAADKAGCDPTTSYIHDVGQDSSITFLSLIFLSYKIGITLSFKSSL